MAYRDTLLTLQAQWCQMVTLQSVQGHTAWSNPPFLISDIRALWHSALSASVPECQKLKM